MNPGLTTSKTDDWSTPAGFFEALNRTFQFQTDVCATASNAKCQRYFTPEQNGLAQEWSGVCWMNPPYGRGIEDWVRKASLSARRNKATVVCLLPARTDTQWWQTFCKDAEVYFVPGRLKFNGGKGRAPFPSAVVVFRPQVAWAFQYQDMRDLCELGSAE